MIQLINGGMVPPHHGLVFVGECRMIGVLTPEMAIRKIATADGVEGGTKVAAISMIREGGDPLTVLRDFRLMHLVARPVGSAAGEASISFAI